MADVICCKAEKHCVNCDDDTDECFCAVPHEKNICSEWGECPWMIPKKNSPWLTRNKVRCVSVNSKQGKDAKRRMGI